MQGAQLHEPPVVLDESPELDVLVPDEEDELPHASKPAHANPTSRRMFTVALQTNLGVTRVSHVLDCRRA